ncbi:MAG: tetratricopeptide repeat protein [Phycisphaerae bacterium]
MLKKTLPFLLCLMMVSTALGVSYIVTYKDGREIEVASATKVKDGYQVKTTAGIEYFIKDSDVEKVTEKLTVEDEYTTRLKKIDPNDAKAHYQLAQWARQKNMPERALEQAKAAVKIDPDYEAAKLLRDLIQAQLDKREDDNGKANGNGGKPTQDGDRERLDKLLLPEDAMLRLRLLELRRRYSDDGMLEIIENVPIQMKNRVAHRFVDVMEGRGIFKNKNADKKFLRAPNRTQAAYMLQWLDKDSEMLNDIHVARNPAFMKEFQRDIWPLVKNIVPEAFGERRKSDLRFVTVRGTNERVDYTNFLILDGYSKGRYRMIDRSHPSDSLLLQWGLPRDVAKIKNPRKNYTPVFRSATDRQYRQVLSWIEKLRSPRPDYNLEGWKPPYGNKLDYGTSLPPAKNRDKDEDKKNDEKDDKPLP